MLKTKSMLKVNKNKLQKRIALEIKLLRTIYTISALFGVVPFYGFNKSKEVYKKTSYTINVIVILHGIGLLYILFWCPYILDAKGISQSLFITECMSYLSYIQIPIIASISCLFRRKYWILFMVKLQNVRSKIKPKVSYLSKKILFLFFILHCIEISNISSHFLWNNKDTKVNLYFYAYEIGVLYLNMLFMTINRIVQVSYKELDGRLKEATEVAKQNKFISDNDVDSVSRLRELFFVYVELSKVIKEINRLFGWIIVALLIYTLLNSVDILNWYIHGEEILNPDFLDLVSTVTYAVCCILTCNYTTNQAKDFINTAYTVEEEFSINSAFRLELLEIAEFSLHYLPTYSVLGFFDINKGTIISLISTLSTYMLVVIQFNLA